MDARLSDPEIQRFIIENTGSDLTRLALAKNLFEHVDWKAVLGQIAARTKAKDKLPTWFNAKNIIYPEKVSIEQTSSEITAEYKSRLVSGKKLIDLTGGFGVADYYFSKKIGLVYHCEANAALSEIARHNFAQLGAAITTLPGDSGRLLRSLDCAFDWIYIDPSRRSDAKGKVFLLGDCLPNVPENLDLYFGYSNNILIKTSPLLDLSAGLKELRNVSEIHIVAVKNEVKELLWVLKKDYSGDIIVRTVDIHDNEKTFDFRFGGDYNANFEMPSDFLYEPNAAIMKSGGFDAVASAFNIRKLHRHSHLYTSKTKIKNFPGRTFRIEKAIPFSKSEMANLGLKKANVTVRNFPDSVESIRRKWKIRDGGDAFCFFTTDLNNDKIVLLCRKI